MTIKPDHPTTTHDVSHRVCEPEALVGADSRADEGGYFPDLRTAAITPSDVSLHVQGRTMESEGLAGMRVQFLVDFAKSTEPSRIRGVGEK